MTTAHAGWWRRERTVQRPTSNVSGGARRGRHRGPLVQPAARPPGPPARARGGGLPVTGLGEAALAYAAAGYAGVPAARQAALRQLPGLRATFAPLPAPRGTRLPA